MYKAMFRCMMHPDPCLHFALGQVNVEGLTHGRTGSCLGPKRAPSLKQDAHMAMHGGNHLNSGT